MCMSASLQKLWCWRAWPLEWHMDLIDVCWRHQDDQYGARRWISGGIKLRCRWCQNSSAQRVTAQLRCVHFENCGREGSSFRIRDQPRILLGDCQHRTDVCSTDPRAFPRTSEGLFVMQCEYDFICQIEFVNDMCMFLCLWYVTCICKMYCNVLYPWNIYMHVHLYHNSLTCMSSWKYVFSSRTFSGFLKLKKSSF